MPVYFFDVIDNGVMARDEFGMDLADFEEARVQAISILPDIARDELPDGELHVFLCHVRDERDRIVYKGNLTYRGERVSPQD